MTICSISAENEVTVRNLLAIYARGVNAHANCLAFADQGEREGIFEAASLFRTVARSEKIHAENHARVIRQLGGEPKANVERVEIRTTLENLTTVLDEVTWKIDSIYPRLLEENGSSDNSAARSLTWALEADKEIARLLTELIQQMRRGKAGRSRDTACAFYVRPVCGYVSRSPEPERCWACEHFCTTFEAIH